MIPGLLHSSPARTKTSSLVRHNCTPFKLLSLSLSLATTFRGRTEFNFSLNVISLGEKHVAYRRLDFPLMKISVVGARPFSCGGEQLFRRSLLSARYGVKDMDGSAKRIYEAALGTPEGHLVIFLAHNGPTGLGSKLNDICGKDWVVGGGDHGDPDLAQAISLLKETGKFCIPLVVFGHMHKELAHKHGIRKMIVVGADNTKYLNGAIVPRVKRLIEEQGTSCRGSTSDETPLQHQSPVAHCEPSL